MKRTPYVAVERSRRAPANFARREFRKGPWHGKFGEILAAESEGQELLHNSLLNKGTAFTNYERDRFGLRGLIPPKTYATSSEALKVQEMRVLKHLESLDNDMDKHLALANVLDRNEVLFYRILFDKIEELAPIIYTPTVGEACLMYGEKYTRARGMYFSKLDQGQMSAMVYNHDQDDVQVIVVTDGSRILGLGDLGTNGMGIPIGKLCLYVACAGIHPSRVLPVMFDVGTNNKKLLADPLYLGVQEPRVTGEHYDELLDEFMRAVFHRWPNALIQFEDFSSDNALRILENYKDKVMCFNDDIQGTGCVSLAGILAGLKAIGQKERDALNNQRVFIVGAGSAGCGIADSILEGMICRGLSREQARKNFWVFSDKGLLGKGSVGMHEIQQSVIRNDLKNEMPLLDAINEFKPTILIGVTGCPGIFTDEILTAMCKHAPRPLIFPLSNPTSRAECTIEDVCRISKGQAIFASGSPFKNQQTSSGKVFYANQMNNMYAFPGLGLGALTSLPRFISDDLLQTAADALADTVPDALLAKGVIFPDLRNIRNVSRDIAYAVAMKAVDTGIAQSNSFPDTKEEFRSWMHRRTWTPTYPTYIKAAKDKVHPHESRQGDWDPVAKKMTSVSDPVYRRTSFNDPSYSKR